MDNSQAKFLLASYRPDGPDAADPIFAEALAQAQRDPTLAKWFAEAQEFDMLLATKLAEIAPPAGLKYAIVVAAQTVPVPLLSIPEVTSRLRQKMYAVAALCVLLAASLLTLRAIGSSSFTTYEGDLVEQIVSGQVTNLAVLDPQPAVLEKWLAAHQAPAAIDVPAGARRFPSLGCRTFTWNGHAVAQICFTTDGGIAHLFVVDRAHWKSAPPDGHPQFTRHGDWTLASWREHGQTYVLARQGNQADLQKLFYN